MNKKQATEEAQRRWGPTAWAEQFSDNDRNWRFMVGRRVRVGMALPQVYLGNGASYEAAFEAADLYKEMLCIPGREGPPIVEGEAARVWYESPEETKIRTQVQLKEMGYGDMDAVREKPEGETP